MSETLRALKLWQVSILVVVLLGAAGSATVFTYLSPMPVRAA